MGLDVFGLFDECLQIVATRAGLKSGFFTVFFVWTVAYLAFDACGDVTVSAKRFGLRRRGSESKTHGEQGRSNKRLVHDVSP